MLSAEEAYMKLQSDLACRRALSIVQVMGLECSRVDQGFEGRNI